ncbi:MAG: phosphatidate cytidylyltransferase [Woeseiaceae bacterium]
MLKQRVLTAIVALIVLAVVLFVVPMPVARAIIALILLSGAWEWGGLIAAGGTASRVGFTAVVAASMIAIFMLLSNPEVLDILLKTALAWWLVALLWMFFFPTPIPLPLVWICGILVLVPAWAALDYLYRLDAQLLLFSLLIVWIADIGAYFVGKGFGRVKLAPKISPGKSWEGVLGGLTAVLLLAAVGNHYLGTEISVLVPLCLAVSMLSIVGDLTVSMFKRNAGVKDSGSVFPGHGGVLDRIDSVSAAVPLFALALGWVGLQ